MRTLLFYTLLSLAASFSVWNSIGWPLNHENLAPFLRTESFLRSFQNGIWIPVWWPAAENGFGSPWPLFYHKLYASLTALLAFVTHSTFTSVQLSIPLLLLLGALGVHRYSKTLGLRSREAIWVSSLFVFAPYTYIDWLRRGAMSEFAAMMIVPWILDFAAKRARWRLALSLVLLFHAHCVIFLFACIGVAIHSLKDRFFIRMIFPGLICAGIGILPFLLVYHSLFQEFAAYSIRDGFWQPQYQIREFGNYFWDRSFSWKAIHPDLTVELGRFLWIALLWGTLRGGIRGVRKIPLFLWIGLGMGLALQTRYLVKAYDWIPYASYIQFPWRLNTFMTLFMCLIFGFQLKHRSCWQVKVLALLQIFAGLQSQWQIPGYFPRARIETAIREVQNAQLPALSETEAMNWFEYLPRGTRLEELRPAQPFIEIINGQWRFIRLLISRALFWGAQSIRSNPPHPITRRFG